jgi:hypothetical protein
MRIENMWRLHYKRIKEEPPHTFSFSFLGDRILVTGLRISQVVDLCYKLLVNP